LVNQSPNPLVFSHQSSVFSRQSSVISRQSSVFSLQSSVFSRQSQSCQSSVISLQSSVFSRQSQSCQSSVFSHQSSVVSHKVVSLQSLSLQSSVTKLCQFSVFSHSDCSGPKSATYSGQTRNNHVTAPRLRLALRQSTVPSKYTIVTRQPKSAYAVTDNLCFSLFWKTAESRAESPVYSPLFLIARKTCRTVFCPGKKNHPSSS